MSVEEILPGNETTVYKTDSLYIIFPEYSSIETRAQGSSVKIG